MKNFLLLIFILPLQIIAQEYSKFVNPLIGTGGHGHTYPGATLPYGMVQLSPDTRIDNSWDGASGYHYSDDTIYGFSHTHLSGTGVTDFGDILLMPTMGNAELNNSNYKSKFSHQNEKAEAGFYKVKLDKHNIDVRLTASTRVGFHEYKFNKNGQGNIILDLRHRDKLLEGEIRIINDKTIEVLRRSEAWAKDQILFARIEFNKPLKLIASQQQKINGKIFTGQNLIMAFSKTVKIGEKILVKVSLSPTGYEGAKLNSSEIKHWNFDQVKTTAKDIWNKELSKIEIKSKNKDQLTIFYTALYHNMIQPNIAQDLDKKYRGRDNKIHTAEGFDYYSVFSLWDTFRATHPLYTLIDKKRTVDYINTFLAQYEQGGRLPVWELASNETDCMIGYHSVSVIADAMAKGLKGFDYQKAFEASKHSAMLDHLGLRAYKENKFISIDDDHESVSKTLEYAYDDWCIAQMALILNKSEDYNYFMNRSQNWKNLYDWTTGFMRPKKNGGWDKPFDPREINNHYTEGNSWQYSFFVPQDITGLINLHGGKENFEKKLDDMFNSESKTTGREQVDVTGLIGQYAHGNEPSHHMVYLYNYVNKPYKTKKYVHYILNEFYKNAPDGLIGNEDCGQMSAWYVLSAMGIYNVNPGQAKWQTTEPFFDDIKINLEDGTIRLISKNSKTSFLETLGFENVIPLRNKIINNQSIAPSIESDSETFHEELEINIESINPETKIFYRIMDETDLNKRKTFIPYTQKLRINKTSVVNAYTENNGIRSAVITAKYYKKPNNYSIKLLTKNHPQYTGGKDPLLDGIKGDIHWKKGYWLGFWGDNFEAIIDLKTVKDVNNVGMSFLQDSRSWILLPKDVEVYTSVDGQTYNLFGKTVNKVNAYNNDIFISENNVKTLKTKKAKYIKIVAKNYGKLPKDHLGNGGDAYIFIDEVTIN